MDVDEVIATVIVRNDSAINFFLVKWFIIKMRIFSLWFQENISDVIVNILLLNLD